MKVKIAKAVELGKIWMKNSLDPLHGYDHVERVEENVLNISKELKLSEYEISLLIVSCWWHDSYKARKKRFTLYSHIFEGIESERIVRRELKKYLDENEMKLVCEMARNHNYLTLYFFLNKEMSNLTRIFHESDTIDALNPIRFKENFSKNRNWFLNMIFWIYFYSKYIPLRNLLNLTNYTKDTLNKFRQYKL